MAEHRTKLLIIGSGPAGYTAAIYAARANLKPTLVAGLQPGGQLTITTDVENYPGFADVIQGPWLMEQMQAQAAHVGTEIINDIITEVDFSTRPFRMKADSEGQLRGRYRCHCDGRTSPLARPTERAKIPRWRRFGLRDLRQVFFRGVDVAVVGGGNTAVEEALYLTNHASKVFLIHRRDSLRAEKILQDRLFKHPKVEILWNKTVAEIVGEAMPPRVNGLTLTDTVSGGRATCPWKACSLPLAVIQQRKYFGAMWIWTTRAIS